MVQQMILSEITNQVSLTLSLVTFFFTVYHWKHFRFLIVIPFMMAISSVTYGLIDQTINDILYDITYVSVALGLVFSRVDGMKSCNKCCNYREVTK